MRDLPWLISFSLDVIVMRGLSFAFPVAVIVFITHPFVVFCLSQMDREKGFSKTREVLEYALLFPATVFDFIR